MKLTTALIPIIAAALLSPSPAFGMFEWCRRGLRAIVSGKAKPAEAEPVLPPWTQPKTAAERDAAFGEARPPRFVRSAERAQIEASDFKPTGTVYSEANPLDLSKLKPGKSYLWGIDEAGNLLVGEEPLLVTDPNAGPTGTIAYTFIGHPGLIGGKDPKMRISGELQYVKSADGKSGKWVINNDSGRYSVYKDTDGKTVQWADRGEPQLKNAQQLFWKAGAKVLAELRKPNPPR